jgi:hypothetical protein
VPDARLLRTFPVHQKQITALAVSGDGRRFAARAVDNTVCVCETDTGKELCVAGGIPAGTFSMGLSPDGTVLVVGVLSDKTPRLAFWDVATGKGLASFDGPEYSLGQVQFVGPDRLAGAAGRDGTVRLYELKRKDGKAPVASGKRQPPEKAELDEAVGKIKESDTFKADYAKVKGGAGSVRDLKALAENLPREGQQAKDDPVRRYALLAEARDRAADAAEAVLCLRAVDEMAADFAFDVRAAKATAMQQVGKVVYNPAAATPALAAMLPLLDEARDADEHEAAALLLAPVRQTARATGDAKLIKAAEEHIAQAERLKKEYDAVREDVRKLKDSPEDADANLAVGRYLCFHKHDWDKALPLLARGSDAALADAAKRELASPASAPDRAALAEAWDRCAAAAPAAARPLVHRRAYAWYCKAMPDLGRDELPKVEKRVAELTKAYPDLLAGWEPFDLSQATQAGGVVHLAAGKSVSSKQPVRGPVEVIAVVRGTSDLPNLEVARAGRALVTLRPLVGGFTGLSMAFPPVEGKGSSSHGLTGTFRKDAWLTVRWVIKEGAIDFATDAPGFGKVRSETRQTDLSKPAVFTLKAGAELEVRSLVIKPLAP